MNEQCKFKVGEYTCGSYAFNLYKENIEQGDYCDRHYWQDRAVKAEVLVDAARADERRFIAEKWEKWYGYDKNGIAEFIRKRANTQEEQT
jgi:hypothetical protein